jgi:hypothetical protein
VAGEISNDKIYELINSTRLELKGDIRDLAAQLQALETGRLTRAEENIGKLQVKDATLSTKVYVLVFIISSVWSAIVTAIAYWLVSVHK